MYAIIYLEKFLKITGRKKWKKVAYVTIIEDDFYDKINNFDWDEREKEENRTQRKRDNGYL